MHAEFPALRGLRLPLAAQTYSWLLCRTLAVRGLSHERQVTLTDHQTGAKQCVSARQVVGRGAGTA